MNYSFSRHDEHEALTNDVDRIIEYINKHEGVEWMPLCEMAKEFREGRMPGVEIEGGADP